MSTTNTIWDWLGRIDYPPPDVKKGERYAQGFCWLCGDSTGPEGWPIKKAFGPTFTDVAAVARLESKACCQACVALSKSDAWAMYVESVPERGFSSHFPRMEGKAARQLNWLYMSHLFTPTSHISPSWKEWRDILCNPPPPPFVAVFAVSQKQQIIFKAKVNNSAGGYWLQVDQESVFVDPKKIGELACLFEDGMKIGLNRSAMASGAYTSQHLKGVNIRKFEEIEYQLRYFREQFPEWMPICEKVSQKPIIIDKPTKARTDPIGPKIGETFALQF